MRIGLLGPIGERTARFEQAAGECFSRLSCQVVFYLGEEAQLLQLLTDKRRAYASAPDALWLACQESLYADAAEVARLAETQRQEQAVWNLQLPELGGRKLVTPSGTRWLLCQRFAALPEALRRWPTVIAQAGGDAWAADERNGQLHVSPGCAPESGLMVVDDGGRHGDPLCIEVFDDRDRPVAILEHRLAPTPSEATL